MRNPLLAFAALTVLATTEALAFSAPDLATHMAGGGPALLLGTGLAAMVVWHVLRLFWMGRRERSLQDLLQSRTAKLEATSRELAAAKKELEELSGRDPVTGLYNRRHFEALLDAEWRRAIRSARPISLIELEVDGFGPFVEAFGSEAGYECLARVASAIVVAHRAGDLLAFNGGAKFGAILPETDLTGALILAERMRARVAGLGIRQAPTSADRFVSISVGVATVIPALGSSCAALEAAASHALLEAKAQGHNRVVPASVAPLSVGAAAQETPLPLR